MQSTDRIPRISHLVELIEQRENAEFKSIVSGIDHPSLIEVGGNVLMHVAAATNNVEMIAYLFAVGFDIDSQNARGQTPLHLAISNRKNQATQLLLSLDASITIADSPDGLSAFQLCFAKESKVPDHTIVLFLERLGRSDLPARRMADLIEETSCSIHRALAVNNAEVIGFLLDGKQSIGADESRDLMERAMSMDCSENVRVLLERGPGSQDRLEIFFDTLTKGGDADEIRRYFRKFIDWDVVTKDLSLRAQKAFHYGSEAEMQVYFDAGVDAYARDKFGWELLAGVFGNDMVDCVKIVEGRKFDVNRLDANGTSALHEAAFCENEKGVVYLLEHGGDPNVKNAKGQTPLFVCGNADLAELLMNAGADLQVIDFAGRTIIAFNSSDYIKANFCILEQQEPLKPQCKYDIEFLENLHRRYLRRETKFGSYRQDLAWMKSRKVSRSVSLFNVLVDEVENTARHVKSEDHVAAILEVVRERELEKIYESMLMKKLEKAHRVSQLRRDVAEFLSRVMQIGPYHLVVEKIVGLLNYKDLLVFDQIDVERLLYPGECELAEANV